MDVQNLSDSELMKLAQGTPEAQAPTQEPSSLSHLSDDEVLKLAQQEQSPEQQADALEANNKALDEKYGGVGQTALADIEAYGKGILGPVATGSARLLRSGAEAIGVNPDIAAPSPEDMRGREEANPITSTIGTVAGLMSPIGQGALLEKAGAGVASKIAGTSTMAAIARPAIKFATENALYQMGDETSKLIMNDPDQSVQSAVANIGLAAAIGGVTGGALGSVSPLWNATFKPKADGILNLLKNKVEGIGLKTDTSFEAFLKNAEEDGVKIAPEIRAALSDNPHLQNMFKQLRDNGLTSGEALTELVKQTKDTANTQIESLVGAGGPTAQEAGEAAKQSLLSKAEDLNKSVKEKYAAIGDVNGVQIPDEARLKSYDKMIEMGQNFGAAGSPQSNLFKVYGERMLAQDSIGQLDKLNTEIGSEMTKAWRAGDTETYKAMASIRDHIRDFQDVQIGKAVADVAKPPPMTPQQKSLYGDTSTEFTEGMHETKSIAEQVVSERRAARAAYHDFMTNLTEMASLSKAGKIKNYSQFEEAIQNIPSMKLAQKLFDPKNLEKLTKLKAEYPDIFDKIVQQQKSDIIEQASKSGVLNHNTVMNKINSLPKEVRDLMFSAEQLKSIESASAVIKHLSSRLNPSGTAGTLNKLWQHVPAAVGAVIGMITGHGVMGGAVLGEITSFLGTGAPNISKMAVLKFLGSDAPVNSGALKAAFDYLNAVQKAQKTSSEAIKNVLKGASKVLPDRLMPDSDSRKKLEKSLADLQKDPSKLANAGGELGHYMPDHVMALGGTLQNITAFLNQIKPQQPPKALLDKELPVSKAVQGQYNRALDIAQQPLIVLDAVKHGTVTSNDIIGLQKMYPALYRGLQAQVYDHMTEHISKGEVIPYKTRIGLSLFLNQALDSSMKPESILMAQPKQEQASQAPNAAPGKSLSQGAASTMAKGAKSAQTPVQASQSMHSTGDA